MILKKAKILFLCFAVLGAVLFLAPFVAATNTQEGGEPAAPVKKTLTVTGLVGGSVSVNGAVSTEGVYQMEPGASVTLSATAEAYYAFSSWSGYSGISSPTEKTVVFVMPEEDVTLNVQFRRTHFTVYVNDSPVGIYSVGANVDLRAGVNPGERFLQWILDGADLVMDDPTMPDQTVQMPARDVRLRFRTEKIVYSFSVNAQGKGTVVVKGKTPNDQGRYEVFYGEKITLSAIPEENSFFLIWSATGGATVQNYLQTETVFTCPASDFSVTAQFANEVKALTVAVSGSGTALPVSSNVNYGVGTQIEVTARPQPGWVFVRWECSSEEGIFADGTAEKTTFLMPGEDCTVMAVFEKGKYFVYLDVTEGGTVEGNEGPYEMGERITVIARAAEGYLFSHWETKNTGVLEDNKKAELLLSVPGETVHMKAVFVTDPNYSPKGQEEDPMENFPYLELTAIFLVSALAIVLIVIREKSDLSYPQRVKRWLNGDNRRK